MLESREFLRFAIARIRFQKNRQISTHTVVEILARKIEECFKYLFPYLAGYDFL
jgi:hypothetical protein